MTYDEAVTIWALEHYGDRTISFFRDGKLCHGKFKDIVNTNYPIELHFEYTEGYNHSEYTNADSEFQLYLKYARTDLDPKVPLFYSIYSNESVPLARITKEIVEISLSHKSSEEISY
jgi:hypothetical protein